MVSPKAKPAKPAKPAEKRVRRSPEEARTVILDAADRVFGAHLPDAVGLKEIAREAGVSHALVTQRSVDAVSRRTLEMLIEATRAERSAIFLLDGNRPELATVLSRLPESEYPHPVTLSSTVAGRILSERKGIVTADAAADERFAHGHSVAAFNLRSIACAPLLGNEGNIGILYMENNAATAAFSQDDLRLLCAVAS